MKRYFIEYLPYLPFLICLFSCINDKIEDRDDLALNVYVAMCYYKLDYYDVSLEILGVYLQSFPDSGLNCFLSFHHFISSHIIHLSHLLSSPSPPLIKYIC